MKLIQPYDLVKVAKLEKLGGKNTARLLMSLLQFDKLNDIYAKHYQKDASLFVSNVLQEAGIKYHVPEQSLRQIPQKGAFILIANHPYGGVEGLILMDIITRIRPDFKIMANFLFEWVDPIKDRVFSVNPFETHKGTHSSYNGLRKAFEHVVNGHPLAIFPAGEVSTYQPGSRIISDREWSTSAIRFIKNAEVPVIPAYFHGSNSWLFHVMGRVHPILRTAKIPSELLNKQNDVISLHVGSAISVKDQLELNDTSSFAPYLRARVYCLHNQANPAYKSINQATAHGKPIAKPVKPNSLMLEIVNMNPDYKLFQWQQYQVYCAPTKVVPNITYEIGRLREITFREAGEGTNEASDIDEFDKYYHQLFIWDSDSEKIIGGYRVGKGKDILKHYGMNGFYTQTLFRMDKEAIPVLNESLELGRSFIIKEYQRKPLSLFLLWKGILHLLWKNPDYGFLVGPVSISNNYSRLSQEIIIEYIKKHHFDNALAEYLKPRHPFISKSELVDTSILVKHTNNLQMLDRLIRESDPTQSKIPVLLRKYLEIGGKIAAFNIDPKFNNVVDGFLILNLQHVREEMIKTLSGRQNDAQLV